MFKKSKNEVIWKSISQKRILRMINNPEKFKNVKLIVDGSLDLSGYTHLTTLPKNLQVNGSLSLSGCVNLTSLPENLEVNGFIILDNLTGLTSISQQINVGGVVHINIFNKKSDLKEIKQCLEVGSQTDLMTWENTEISSFSDELNDVFIPVELYRFNDCPLLAEDSMLRI